VLKRLGSRYHSGRSRVCRGGQRKTPHERGRSHVSVILGQLGGSGGSGSRPARLKGLVAFCRFEVQSRHSLLRRQKMRAGANGCRGQTTANRLSRLALQASPRFRTIQVFPRTFPLRAWQSEHARERPLGGRKVHVRYATPRVHDAARRCTAWPLSAWAQQPERMRRSVKYDFSKRGA
jgi:hypothetical protein